MGYKRKQPYPTFSLSDPLPPEDNMATHPKTKPDVAPQRVFMTAAETIAAGILLQSHCKPVITSTGERTKFHAYDKGWDDDKVAKETGERLNGDHIKRLRRQLEMKFDPASSLDYSGKTLQARVSKLSQAVGNLQTYSITQADLKVVQKVIEHLSQRATDDFKDLDGRITDVRDGNNRVEQRFDNRMDGWEVRLNNLELRVDAIDGVLKLFDERLINLENLVTSPLTTEK